MRLRTRKKGDAIWQYGNVMNVDMKVQDGLDFALSADKEQVKSKLRRSPLSTTTLFQNGMDLLYLSVQGRLVLMRRKM